jgi:hypothetical protein
LRHPAISGWGRMIGRLHRRVKGDAHALGS